MHWIPILALFSCSPGRRRDPPASPWAEIRLTISRDPYTSSDQVTLCRVRARSTSGSRTWPGRALALRGARASDGGPRCRERGRFGLELAPHGSLETLIALPGRHDRFEVVPLRRRAHADEARAEGAAQARRAPPEASGLTRDG